MLICTKKKDSIYCLHFYNIKEIHTKSIKNIRKKAKKKKKIFNTKVRALWGFKFAQETDRKNIRKLRFCMHREIALYSIIQNFLQ